MKKTLLIGCPTANRGWIIRAWLNHLHAAILELKDEFEIGLILVADEHDESVPVTEDFCRAMGYRFRLVAVEEDREVDKRDWSRDRLNRMVYLRNVLLENVRRIGPDYFLSLDSDILLHRDALACLVESISTHDATAVGGKTYMTRIGRGAPSCAKFRRGKEGLVRPDGDGVFKIDVIMAIKLMSPAAYSVNYRFHTHGEDIGWSAELRERKLPVYWDGRVGSKHIMERDQLFKIDPRVGF